MAEQPSSSERPSRRLSLATLREPGLLFVAIFVGSLLINWVQLQLNSWYYGLILGGLAGALLGGLSRRLISGRSSWRLQVVALVAVLLSTPLVLLIGYRVYGVSVPVILSAAAMGIALYTIFMPRSEKYQLPNK